MGYLYRWWYRVVVVVVVDTLAASGLISRPPHGRIDVMSGPVVTTEAHHAFSGARSHSMIEAFSFLGSRGLVALVNKCARVSTICDSCSAQTTTYHAPRVWSKGNFGNECADHAGAFGTFRFVSSHNVVSRWTRHNFDVSERPDGPPQH